MFENKYPYTDFHELNLDWFLAKFKEMMDAYAAFSTDMTEKFNTLDATVKEFTDFVTNYFDNLDVQQEINHKLDVMAADGTLDALLLPYFNAYKAEINGIVADQNQTINTQNGRITVLEGRMDSFASLTEGSTTGDAELMDIRVGALGETYATAGDAVRDQVGDIYAILDVDVLTPTYTAGQYFNGATNTFATSSNFSLSEPFLLKRGETVYIKALGIADLVGILNSCDDVSYTNAKCVVICDSNTVKTYEYVVQKTGYYFTSFQSSGGNTCEIKKVIYQTVQDSRIEDLEESSVKILSGPYNFEKNMGYYVNAVSGAISANENYWMSDIIPLYKGCSLSVTFSDPSGPSVGTVSSWTKDGLVLIDILETGSVSETTFNYTANNTVYIILSGFKNSPFSVSIDGFEIPTVLESAISVIANDSENVNFELSASMFSNAGVCGDSFTAGAVYSSGVYLGANEKISWGKCFGRMNGIDVNVYATVGADTETWQKAGDVHNRIDTLLNDDPLQLYILCLGINDYSYVTLGDITDITSHESYEDYPNTFYGNYGKIIERIAEHAPDAKMIISKVFIPVYQGGAAYTYSSTAIEEIAAHYNIPFIETADSALLTSNFYNTKMENGHPTGPMYSGIAKFMTAALQDLLFNEFDYFKDFYPS